MLVIPDQKGRQREWARLGQARRVSSECQGRLPCAAASLAIQRHPEWKNLQQTGSHPARVSSQPCLLACLPKSPVKFPHKQRSMCFGLVALISTTNLTRVKLESPAYSSRQVPPLPESSRKGTGNRHLVLRVCVYTWAMPTELERLPTQKA